MCSSSWQVSACPILISSYSLRYLISFWPNLREVTVVGSVKRPNLTTLNAFIGAFRAIAGIKQRIASKYGVEAVPPLMPHGFIDFP
jgi:hypothetical protein